MKDRKGFIYSKEEANTWGMANKIKTVIRPYSFKFIVYSNSKGFFLTIFLYNSPFSIILEFCKSKVSHALSVGSEKFCMIHIGKICSRHCVVMSFNINTNTFKFWKIVLISRKDPMILIDAPILIIFQLMFSIYE